MKKFLYLFSLLIVLTTSGFSQMEENGKIFIKHPYINVVNNATNAYLTQDFSTLKTIYSDTARWWISGMADFIPIADAMKIWAGDFEKYDSVKQVQFGYPDYLEYIKDNSKIVQSWWTWSGKSKKDGTVKKVPMVMFDEFNKDGKIVREYIFGDFSSMQ